MKVFIKTDRNGYVTIHKNHRPRTKDDVLNEFLNRDGETVYEYTNKNGQSSVSFIETELQD